MSSTGVGVSLDRLSKEFGEKLALNAVSLEVEPGSFLVLLGPSGSGKTTLLRCLAGIERPSSGSITIDERLVVGGKTFVAPDKRHLAMVFQDYALWPHLTVRKNVGFPLASTELSKDERDRRCTDLLERVGIGHLADRYPNQLSGGEQQRVALARALAADVGLILFDEPLSNLDADRREQLRIEIATLTREAGATAVYITHDQSEAFALADRIGVLNLGQLIQFDTPENIYAKPTNAFVARFTGVAGEFPVDVVRKVGEGHHEVVLPFASGHVLQATSSNGVAPTDKVSLFVRSVGVSLSAPSDGDGVGGMIRDVAFNGHGYDHVVDVGDGFSLTKIFSNVRFERGRNVKVRFEPSSCFVMDASKEVPAS
ncbi:MAG TPA: ABC transporter ATP-binding protein [Acidimicrobiales bacterium]|jgi:iron(III) transport system ATP-binding protein|nr:ABC transporter ATP-binding protein [Acidimicrobiales bacterium]